MKKNKKEINCAIKNQHLFQMKSENKNERILKLSRHICLRRLEKEKKLL